MTYNVPVPVMAVFAGDDIGLHSPDHIQQLALRTAQSIPYKLVNDYISLAMVKVRLGQDVMKEFEQNTRTLSLLNGALMDTGVYGIWVENFSTPIVMNESLIQSYNGTIRFAPVKLGQAARFANLRVVGAFLVSGEIKPGGKLEYAAITSEAGVDCRVISSWNGEVRVRNAVGMQPIKTSTEGSIIWFKTMKGETYIIDNHSEPWEKQPMVQIAGRTY